MKHCEHESDTQSNHASSETDWKQYAMLAAIGILFVVTLIQGIQLNALQGQTATSAAFAAAPALSSGGSTGAETNAQMMARMHPDQVQPKPSGGGSTMVGGC